MSGRIFLDWTSIKEMINLKSVLLKETTQCLRLGSNPSISIQALDHWATTLLYEFGLFRLYALAYSIELF